MTDLLEEAEKCRMQALTYVGRPEGAFLLRVAQDFERLAREPIGGHPKWLFSGSMG